MCYRIAVVVGGPKGVDDGVLGFHASSKGREHVRVAVAERNQWSGVVVMVEVAHQLVDDASRVRWPTPC